MKIAKLLGYTQTKTHYDAGTREYQDHDEGGTETTFYIGLDNKHYTFNSFYSYGSCGSGWCGASWGFINPELVLVNEIPTTLTKVAKDIFINVVNDRVRIGIQEPSEEHFYDATTEEIKDVDGIMIVSATGDGGCQYYSSGIVVINDLLFE